MNMKTLAISAGSFAALGGLYLLINDQSTSATYQGIWLLPFTFVVIAVIMSGARQFRSVQFKLTFAVLATLFFIRLVVTPLAIHFSGPDYFASSYLSTTPEQVFTAILLISWESIAGALFFFVATCVTARKGATARSVEPPIALQGSQIVYGAIALIGVALIVSFGIPRGLINFFSVSEGTVEVERSSLDMLLIQVMIAGAWLVYLLTIHREGLRYRRRPALMPFLIGLVAGILVLMLIFGDRRSIQLYTGIAVATTLFAVFPDRKRAIVSSIVIATVTVIATVSFWRMFARHDIDLTSAALLGPSFIATIATSLQSYYGGPYQVAAANGILLSEGVGLGNVVFDFLRSTFVVNFFVDDSRMLTSQIMNANIYNGTFMTGWLISTTSYGAATLSPVFMPLFLILNIALAMVCESVFRSARGLEVRFLFIYLFARMSFFPFTATPLLISFFTIQLFTIGLIFFAAILVKRIDRPFVKKTSWT
jgi:hypothetical protein